MSARKQLHVIIHGTVQGVNYRNWTVLNAMELHLDGWVRNLRDGSVEAVFAGDNHNLSQMLDDCRKGPPMAMVDSLDITPYDGVVEPGFERLPTA